MLKVGFRCRVIDPEIGLLERLEALALGIWTVRALFILVDCAPAIAKFTSGATVYDRLVRRRPGVGEIQHATLALDDTAAAHRWAQFKKDTEALERARSAAERLAMQDKILDDVEERMAREETDPQARGFPARGSRYSYGEP